MYSLFPHVLSGIYLVRSLCVSLCMYLCSYSSISLFVCFICLVISSFMYLVFMYLFSSVVLYLFSYFLLCCMSSLGIYVLISFVRPFFHSLIISLCMSCFYIYLGGSVCLSILCMYFDMSLFL